MSALGRRVNWPLIFGGIIVLAVTSIALFGKQLAPRDPTAGVFILQDANGTWVKPPFPAIGSAPMPRGAICSANCCGR